MLIVPLAAAIMVVTDNRHLTPQAINHAWADPLADPRPHASGPLGGAMMRALGA